MSVHLDELREHLDAYLRGLPHAPVHSLREIIASGKHSPGIKANLEKALALSTGTEAFRKKRLLRADLQKHLVRLMAEHNLDAIVYPHQQQLVCKVGGSQQERNGALCAVTGFPSIAVPAGFSPPAPDAPLGVPVGMEIAGRPWSEPLLIAIAYAFEQVSRFRKAPDLDGAVQRPRRSNA